MKVSFYLPMDVALLIKQEAAKDWDSNLSKVADRIFRSHFAQTPASTA